MLIKMKCPYCGADMEVNNERDSVFCSYCGSQITNLREKIKEEITIDRPPVDSKSQSTLQSNQYKTKGQSVLGIIAFILSLTGYGSFIGVPLAIVDLVRQKKDEEHKHGLAIAGLVIGIVMLLVLVPGMLRSINRQNSYSASSMTSGRMLEEKNDKVTTKPTNATDTAAPRKTAEPTKASTPIPTTPKPTAVPETKRGIRPEFQKAMDEYLQFFKDYCEFFKKYTKSPDASMAMQYLSFMQNYTEAMEALDKIDEGELSAEELKLYLDTMNEINKLLIDLSNGL